MFYFENIKGKKIMKSSVLDGLNHFFTTRESIIKTKEHEFENLVKENKKMFCEYFSVSNIVSPHQTHSANVQILKQNTFEYPETDGLIIPNDIKNTIIHLNFADCTPLIFYDGKISAISHAGWRGTAGSIAKLTVQKMQKEFSSKIENIKCAIGAAISVCCYNVKDDVLKELLSTVKNSDGLYKKENDLIYVDLKAINKRQLTDIGLKPENIDVCPYCTVCNNDIFYSYRKENGTTNRHSACIAMQ